VQSALLDLITGRGDTTVTPDPSDLIVGDQRASAEERLSVYAYMYRTRIAEALESQFPRLARHLGPDAFADLALAYVTDEPSTYPSLRFIGRRLPAWLEAHEADRPGLAGLARLEWARTDVFDLADEPALTLDALRAWPVDRFGELPLKLIGASALVTVSPGTAALWDALGPHEIADAVAPGPATPSGHTETLLVWREGTFVYHRALEARERAALELAAAGTQFGVVCETLLASHGEAGAVTQAYAWLSTWLADGLVSTPASAQA
jgi:hypothetical protein